MDASSHLRQVISIVVDKRHPQKTAEEDRRVSLYSFKKVFEKVEKS